ncbi:MazG-like family protein [Cytobacillus horneckiae]|uniref:NTP pyrophosphohydrolase MazG putative catalytic core domain-containing protein n=1 Tax=Cytobacillus horneckiae TaxID=549687 RepID=A0A2N0ZGR1_9BACI|nr:MazG-like family protein [Cytobacillus horneckiae]MEC1157672.1 MazG-like family protein [Cytobacillus horneckiae]MED2939659.1 MazG-like family protein [Cytobacillus horneckiae]PKG28692.1 hypothetical protein CWS20_12510 [Cytobacillus horneckiae]
MKHLQKEYQAFQEEMGFDRYNKDSYQENKTFLLYIHMLLTTEVAEVAEEFRTLFIESEKRICAGMDEVEALEIGKDKVQENLGKELADCFAYICKLANYFDYDLENELYKKFAEIKERQPARQNT